MDTFASISCYSPDARAASRAMKEAFGEIDRIGKVLSKFDEDSEIARINMLAAKEKVIIDPEVFDLIERSIYYSRLSGGSFDITAQPMKKGRYKGIILDRDDLSIGFVEGDIKIDLGGIAKGYAVDRARGILASHGIENALIDIGGNIFALGSVPRKEGWDIGIRHPREKDRIAYKFKLKDKAVATSGDYERPFHIIDPETGMPAEGVVSVTVVSDSAEKADALSTAVFVMGIEEGKAFIASIDATEAYIFDKDLIPHFSR